MHVTEDITHTLRANDGGHLPVILSYGFEPGVAQRLNPEGRFSEELSPTLRSNAGDNQTAVVVVYGFKPMQGEKAHGMGFEKEKAPSLTATSSCGGGVLIESTSDP